MVTAVEPFITLKGQGPEALAFYLAALPGATCVHESGVAPFVAFIDFGAFRIRLLELTDQRDGFEMSSAISLFLTCDSTDELDAIAEALSQGGTVFMPVGVYPFGERFCWLQDRFGVNWQLIFGEKHET